MKYIWQEVRLADLFTLLNAAVGVYAMIVAGLGELVLAAELVLVGILLDGIDGAVARLGFGGSHVGPKLDSLSDAVTFAAAPAVVLAAWRPDWLGFTLAAVLLSAALLRLARFEAMRETFPKEYFQGLSSPGAALAVGSIILAPQLEPYAAVIVVVASALMLANMRLPKLRNWMALPVVALLLAILAGHGQDWQPYAVWTTLGFLALYVVAGPGWVRRKIDTPPPPSAA